MKKLLTLGVAIALILSVAVASAATTLKLSEVHAEGYPTTLADQEFARLVEERTEGQTLLVRISLQEGWNEMIIDEGARTVAMHDADCSLRKDCTHMLPLGSGGSVITCIPHALKITPLTGEDLFLPSVG